MLRVEDNRIALKLLKSVIHTLGWRYLAYIVAVIGFGLVALLPAQLFRFFTQGIQTLQPSMLPQFIFHLSLLGFAVGVTSLLSSMGNILCQEWLRLKIESHLRRKVLGRLQEVSLTELDGVQRGDWLTRMTADLHRVEMFLTESLPNQLRHATIFIGTSILFIAYTGKLALIPIALALGLALLNWKVQNRLTPALADLRGLHSNVFQMLIESFEGIRTIRSQGAEAYIQRRFNGRLHEISSKSIGIAKVMGTLIGGTGAVTQVMITGCLVVIAWTLSKGQLTFDQVLIYPFFLGHFYGSAQGLSATFYDWNRFFIEGGRLAKILLAENGIQILRTNPLLQECRTFILHDTLIGHHPRTLTAPLHLTLNRGDMCAILGPSGSGKSTFLELIAGIRPALKGRLELRDQNNRVIWKSSKSTPSFPIGLCAYVEQSPYLFEGTLRDNLTLGGDRASDAILWQILERIGMAEFVHLNRGLEFSLHDRGLNLSEGERYRIALGRALLLNRPFLILDEPFGSLDEGSVEIVCNTLENESQKSGILLVTHFLPDTLELDKVWMLGKAGLENKIVSKRNRRDANTSVRKEETLCTVLPAFHEVEAS